MACDNVLCIFTGELVSMTQKNAALIVEGLLTYTIDLKIWFKGMRTRYGKLTSKKSGDGAKEHTDSFLDDQISRVPSRQSCNSVTLHTDLGDVKLELFCEQCPRTCENFMALCGSDYYNGCIFHRNIKGFMVQTGDPTGTGKGGQSIWGKNFPDEFDENLKHNVRGVISMANSGTDTNGSQFFITYGKQPSLDMKYSIFGKVIDGWEALDEMEKQPVKEKSYRPLNEFKIQHVTIHANPIADGLVS